MLPVINHKLCRRQLTDVKLPLQWHYIKRCAQSFLLQKQYLYIEIVVTSVVDPTTQNI